MSESIFDSADFNARLFFPRPDSSPPPPGARDLRVLDWHVRVHGGDGKLLLLFHGNGEVVADYDDAAADFRAAGFRLAVCDYPGYGQSAGSPTLRRIVTESSAVVDAVKPAVVMGRSLGSACAHEQYARGLSVVLESGFYDLRALVRRRNLPVPEKLDEPGLSPRLKLGKGRGAALVIHGLDDQAISSEEARAAFDAIGGEDKTLVLIAGRGHNDVSFAPGYWQALLAFATGRR